MNFDALNLLRAYIIQFSIQSGNFNHNIFCRKWGVGGEKLSPLPFPTLYPNLLPLQCQHFLQKLVGGLDCPGIGLETPLGDDHVGKLFGHVNV